MAVMKQIGIWVISFVCIVGLNTARAEEGEAIFKAQGVCHVIKKKVLRR